MSVKGVLLSCCGIGLLDIIYAISKPFLSIKSCFLTAKLCGSSRYFVVVTHFLAFSTFHTLVRPVND